MFSARAYLEELGTLAPTIVEAYRQALEKAAKDRDFTRLDRTAFEACPKNSIDYALMEKTSRAVAVPLDAGWSDVGPWAAVHEVSKKDADGNTAHGDVVVQSCRNCFVYAGDCLVTAVGLKDHFVIDTKDAVMVGSKEHAQELKRLVEQLNREQREQTKPQTGFPSLGQL